MAKSSIFDGVVTTENQYTRLLYNLLLRDSAVRASFVSFLTSSPKPSPVGIDQIGEQAYLPNGGFADLLIQTKNLSVIVEVKTAEGRDLTGRQLIDVPDDDPDSYISYLAGKAKQGFAAHLIFLIPSDWKYRIDVEGEIEKFKNKGRTKAVVVKQLTWSDLSRTLTSITPAVEASLFTELINLLNAQFTPAHLTDEELKMLKNGNFTPHMAVKLYKIIEDVHSLAKKAKLPVSETVADEDNFGFIVEDKQNKQNGHLWFGCLPLFPWKGEMPLLCIQGDPKAEESCKKVFVTVFGHSLKPEGEWITAAISNKDLGQGAECVFAKLQKVWQIVARAEKV